MCQASFPRLSRIQMRRGLMQSWGGPDNLSCTDSKREGERETLLTLDMRTPFAYNTGMEELTREQFREWGATGGKKRSKKMSAARRKASARKAARARWAKQKGKGKR